VVIEVIDLLRMCHAKLLSQIRIQAKYSLVYVSEPWPCTQTIMVHRDP